MTKKEEKASHERALQTTQAAQAGFPSPFEEMERWFEEASPRNWLAPMFRRWPAWPAWPELESPFGGHMPKVDVLDRPQEVVVRAELPGVTKDGLDISLSERTLTIRASTRHEKKEDDEHYHRRELTRGEFLRTIVLPTEVNSDKAKASFKDGVLELTLPKVESAKRKSIKVE